MAIKTNLKSLLPAREQYKREITLLSAGYVAPQAFPEGKITVYPWDSTVDEFLQENARKGGATLLFDLLPKICNLNGCPVDSFTMGDLNTVLLVSRSISRENKIIYDAVCTACNTIEKTAITVPDQLEKIGEKTADYQGFDFITLPVCKDIVKVRPLVIGDIKTVTGRSEESKKMANDKLATVISGITGINDSVPESAKELVQWYRALHPNDTVYLEKQQDELSPQLSTNIHHVCKCGHKFDHTIVLDTDFFRSVYVPVA